MQLLRVRAALGSSDHAIPITLVLARYPVVTSGDIRWCHQWSFNISKLGTGNQFSINFATSCSEYAESCPENAKNLALTPEKLTYRDQCPVDPIQSNQKSPRSNPTGPAKNPPGPTTGIHQKSPNPPIPPFGPDRQRHLRSFPSGILCLPKNFVVSQGCFSYGAGE